tara:strand:+ start:10 stop:267 length:258 start_codon:yes stop_codon:yes gene_type:complete
VKVTKITRTNPVAKHSRNKSGAGYHKDKTKYDRKQMKIDTESIASKLDRLVLLEKMQENCNSPSLWFSYEEEILQIKEDLENADY